MNASTITIIPAGEWPAELLPPKTQMDAIPCVRRNYELMAIMATT